MKTLIYNPNTHVLVPREPTRFMVALGWDSAVEHGADNIDSNDTAAIYRAMIAAAPQPEPNHNWCAGCSPDNCSGCGTEPVAYIFKPNNELLWPHEVEQNVFASDPEDYDLLYTTPQPDRTAELEAVLKVAREVLEMCKERMVCEPYAATLKALAKINEVLK